MLEVDQVAGKLQFISLKEHETKSKSLHSIPCRRFGIRLVISVIGMDFRVPRQIT